MKVIDVCNANLDRKVRIYSQYGWHQCGGRVHFECYGFDQRKNLDVLEYWEEGDIVSIRIRYPD